VSTSNAFNGKWFGYSNPVQGFKNSEASGVEFFSWPSFTALPRPNPALKRTAAPPLSSALEVYLGEMSSLSE
jgi:hypothetical protein